MSTTPNDHDPTTCPDCIAMRRPTPTASLVERLNAYANETMPDELTARSWARWIDRTATGLLARDAILALEAKLGEARKDAARWRALVGSGHMSMMGWAGFDKDGKSRHNAKHFCINIWEQSQLGPVAPADLKASTEATRKHAESILTNYADSIATLSSPETKHEH